MEKSISILPKLAVSIGRKNENPNIDLAIEIVKEANKTAIKELVNHLENNNKGIQSNCVKEIAFKLLNNKIKLSILKYCATEF